MTGIVLRKSVPAGLTVAEYRQPLREDFYWSCAYCSITELEACGIAFEVDHHVPEAEGGTDEYSNLFYSCDRCNGNKRAIWPRAQMLAAGARFVRVDEDDPRDHIEVDQYDVDLVREKSAAGKFTIKVIDLNRPALMTVRQLRRAYAQSSDTIAHGLRLLAGTKLDLLPPKARAEVVQARRVFAKEFGELSDKLPESLRELVASPLLEPDPERQSRTKARRAYLDDLKAILPKEK